jgi:hypothetical protein
MTSGGRVAPTPEAALRTARILAAALTVGPLSVVAVAALVPPIEALKVLLLPAVVLAVVCFAGGLALHARMTRPGPDLDLNQRIQRFHVATLVALGLTEGAALLGGMAFFGERSGWALLPVAAHLGLTVLVWPTRSRFERACVDSPGSLR